MAGENRGLHILIHSFAFNSFGIKIFASRIVFTILPYCQNASLAIWQYGKNDTAN